jgi:hypothetical protein
MRINEISDEEDIIRNTKFKFDKALYALVAKYKRQLEIQKNKQRMAKKQIKNRKIRAHRNDVWDDVKKPDRPQR